MRRPRFVIFLAAASVAAAVHGLSGLAIWPTVGAWLALLETVAYLGTAWGLWMLRPWARILAMVYLGYLLLSFLLWGVRGFGEPGVVTIMAWQIMVLPVLTFCFMYLYNGRRYFHAVARH